jgi:hypothetical protein
VWATIARDASRAWRSKLRPGQRLAVASARARQVEHLHAVRIFVAVEQPGPPRVRLLSGELGDRFGVFPDRLGHPVSMPASAGTAKTPLSGLTQLWILGSFLFGL